MKYIFSGHESFTCKTLWLKKGFEFSNHLFDYNAPQAVITLGVGKNMVSSIRYWSRAFGIIKEDKVTDFGTYLLDNAKGKDPYMEDLGTLWLLHYKLVSQGEATLYNLVFGSLQKERKTFDRQNVMNFVYRKMMEDGKQKLFNENTVKKDVGVLLQNYVMPQKAKALDDYNALLIDLELIRTEDGKTYQFNTEGKRKIPWQIFLYAILDTKGTDYTVSYDTLQYLGLVFCMTDMEVIDTCKEIIHHYPTEIIYSDTAGIRQLQFVEPIGQKEVLDEYYGK